MKGSPGRRGGTTGGEEFSPIGVPRRRARSKGEASSGRAAVASAAMHTLYRDFENQAQIDAQYNTALTVTDPQAQIGHYVRAGPAPRPAALHARRRFRPDAGRDAGHLSSRPSGSAGVRVHPRRLLARVHVKEFSGVALGLQPLGITTVVVNYALCPRVSIDEITRQTRAALAWVAPRRRAWRRSVAWPSAAIRRSPLAAMCLQTRWDGTTPAAGPAPAAPCWSAGCTTSNRCATATSSRRSSSTTASSPQLAGIRRAALRHAGLGDLGRGRNQVRAPVAGLPRRLAGGRQPQRAFRAAGRTTSRRSHGGGSVEPALPVARPLAGGGSGRSGGWAHALVRPRLRPPGAGAAPRTGRCPRRRRRSGSRPRRASAGARSSSQLRAVSCRRPRPSAPSTSATGCARSRS